MPRFWIHQKNIKFKLHKMRWAWVIPYEQKDESLWLQIFIMCIFNFDYIILYTEDWENNGEKGVDRLNVGTKMTWSIFLFRTITSRKLLKLRFVHVVHAMCSRFVFRLILPQYYVYCNNVTHAKLCVPVSFGASSSSFSLFLSSLNKTVHDVATIVEFCN